MNTNAEPFKTEAQAAGKTWARIVDDLLRLIPGTGYLALTPLRAASSCSARPFNSLVHIDSPDLPIVEVLDAHSTRYNFIISNLRYHVEVTISSRDKHSTHDFHLVSSNIDPSKRREEYMFVSNRTATTLNIVIRPPEFTDDDLKDFQEPAIKERFEKYKDQKPSATLPHPANCYNTLFKIIRQPLLVSQEPKEIMVDNPTLNISINREILTRKVFFTKDESRNSFSPPHVHDNVETDGSYSVSKDDDEDTLHMRRAMTRMLLEVAVLAHQSQEQNNQYIFSVPLENGASFLRSVLRNTHHPSANPKGSNAPSLSDQEYSNYVVLGAADYFSDELIMDRYEIQTGNDPENGHYYMEALKHISQIRNSEELQIKVMELLSLGAVPLSDVNDAYSQFGIDSNDIGHLDEDLLIDAYKDMIRQNPSSKSKLSKSLKIIGDARKSDKIRNFLSMESMDVNEAYRYLNTAVEADDDTVRVSFDLKSNELGEGNDDLAKIALLRIAEARKSPGLFNYYESLSFGTLPEFPLDTAYQMIGVDKSMDVQSIITTFEIRVNDSPDQALSLRQALRTIGQEIQSDSISKYLETGSTVGNDDGNNTGPVGLNNIGNTCYLNSLLQYYFTLVPIRDAVLNYQESTDRENPDDSVELKVKKVGGRQVPSWEVKRSQEFICYLSRLFHELIHTKERWVSPKKDLAYLALVPPTDESELEFIANERKKSEEKESNPQPSEPPSLPPRPVSEGTKGESNESPMLIDLEAEEQQEDNKENIPTEQSEVQIEETQDDSSDQKKVDNSDDVEMLDVVNNDADTQEEQRKRIDSALFGRQQDVTECIENVLFQIEASFKPKGYEDDGEQVDIVKELFFGANKQILESAEDGSNRREKTERFSSLLVDVAEGPRDLHDALDSYFGEDIVNLEGVQTRRSVTISKLPPVLQIQVQRVQFDRVNFRPFKSLALLKFDETMYMDRYLDTTDPEVIAKRRQVWAWKVELNDVKARLERLTSRQSNGMTLKDTLIATCDWFKNSNDPDLTVSAETIETLNSQIEKLQTETEDLQTKKEDLEIKIKTQFQDMKQYGYRIHAVFVHRGQATFGHYWIYINDHKNGVFRKYNDEYVTEVPYSEVFDDSEENTATPYFLVYVREDLVDEYVESLKREPEEE